MRPVHFLYGALWIAAGIYAWVSGPWSAPHTVGDSIAHDSMFHMHQPLHDGGKVAMVGQFHLELASRPDGTHRLWVSDAYRKEMEAKEFSGTLRIEREGVEPIEVGFFGI